jgi:hypothetical protein
LIFLPLVSSPRGKKLEGNLYEISRVVLSKKYYIALFYFVSVIVVVATVLLLGLLEWAKKAWYET